MRSLLLLSLFMILGCGGQKNIKDPSSGTTGAMTVIYQGPLNPGSMSPIQSIWEVADVEKGVTSGAVRFTLRLTLENDQIKTVVVSSMEAMCEPFAKSRSLPGPISVDTTFSDGRHSHETDPAKSDIWQGFQHAKALKDLCEKAGVPYG